MGHGSFFKIIHGLYFRFQFICTNGRKVPPVPGEDELKGNKTINIHGTRVDLSDK